jgi:DNA helicase-2/ATP-dependent DNA helicase PcrA
MPSFLETHGRELNDRQLKAVSSTEGPLLVLAGAGSGKTRVLTYRIAHLIYDHFIPIDAILAMTFSNKAAREMHDRVKILLGENSPARLPWISTFHSVCARILRLYGGRIGYTNDFAIYDEADQKGVVKECLARLQLSDQDFSPDAVLNQIGDWKNKGRLSSEVENLCRSSFENTCADLYRIYSEELRKVQAMDFDDLLLNTYRLFREQPDIKQHFHEQWRYILVDEFQDTNELQYKLLREMINPLHNICVVGDDDQSIYGWRGARIENILEFDKEFQGCTVVKLEQNYRSTGNILKAAESIISKNKMRHEKTLWTNSRDGEKIRLVVQEDDRDEAHYVVGEIKRLVEGGIPASEIAVLYRVNALSRGFEEECLRYRLPYQIVGGFRFYERKEIKDLLSYFKIFLNPADLMAFRRTVNTPLRGIGATSVEKLETFAAASGKSIGHWMAGAESIPISGKAREGISQYQEILKWGLSELQTSESLVDLLIDLVKRTRYVEILKAQKSEESSERIQNIEELLSAVQQFVETFSPQVETSDSLIRQKLRAFLEQVSLISDVDAMQADEEKVTLMSLHAAKGLEFRVCFLAGMEEGLFPSARSFDSYEKTEEERRLCYVGFTRAKEKLYLTRAERRRVFGSINFCVASRFLKDLPSGLLAAVEDSSHSSEFRYSWKPRAEKQKLKADWDDFEFDQRTSDDFGFHKGDRIMHPSFGEGIVQKAELLGNDECLSVAFARRGMKKVLSKFVTKA